MLPDFNSGHRLFRFVIAAPLALILSQFVACGLSNNDASKPIERDNREVAFVTTPQVCVERMLELCEPGEDDFVLDLGCGDGRILITAAKKYGCRGLGFDIDPKLIQLCKETAKRQGVEHLVEFRQQDIYQVELPREATIVTMYLYPEMNLRLLPYLQSLADGKQVVSYRWEMPGVPSDKIETLETGDRLLSIGTIHYFKTPLLVDPDWNPEDKTPVQIDFEKIKDRLKYREKKSGKTAKRKKRIKTVTSRNQSIFFDEVDMQRLYLDSFTIFSNTLTAC